MPEITNKPIFMVTFPDDGSYPGTIVQTSIERLKALIVGMQVSGQQPGITMQDYAFYDDEVEANREAIRRLKLMRDVIDKEIAELEEEL